MSTSVDKCKLGVEFIDRLKEPMPSLLNSRAAKAPTSPLRSTLKSSHRPISPSSPTQIIIEEFKPVNLKSDSEEEDDLLFEMDPI